MSEGQSIMMAVVVFLLIAFSPAIVLFIVGAAIHRSKPQTAKVLFIIGGIYLIVGLGICGLLMN